MFLYILQDEQKNLFEFASMCCYMYLPCLVSRQSLSHKDVIPFAIMYNV